jgi:hypothetical protein
MPDISMCMNSEHCPLAYNCYRAEESGTKPSERQSWMSFRYGVNDEDVPGCYNLIPVKLAQEDKP